MNPKRQTSSLAHQITDCKSPIRQMVSKKSRQLRGHACLRLFDHDDIEQTIWKYLLKSLAKFDPARGSLSAFCKTVIDSSIANLIRQNASAVRYGK
ncbi:MAG: hypothetical protein KDA78_12475, partial [Planctomycetaceae bacterium]|nr:hypothetical protein [Planctomycetaceae bacterium]